MRASTPLLLSLVSLAMVSAQKRPGEVKPVVAWTGGDSQQATEFYSRSATRAEWDAVWESHQGRDRSWFGRPEVDFGRYMVIAIFTGEGGSDRGIEIKCSYDEPDCVRLRYRLMSYQVATGQFGPSQVAIRTRKPDRAFVFAILPKSVKGVVLEQDVSGLLSGPPVWKERARLPAAPMN